MKTRSFRIDKRRRSYLRLIGEIKHALAQALAEEHAERGLTMAEMARTLEVDRSHISRKLSGETNMTLETLADLAYALDRPVKVSLPSRHTAQTSNYAHTASRGDTPVQFHQNAQAFKTASSTAEPPLRQGPGFFIQAY
jgi:transcriptional regulator with XRE-family HTH domain